jgi:hypothetical protein
MLSVDSGLALVARLEEDSMVAPVDHQAKSRQYLAEAEAIEALASGESGEAQETLLAIARHWRGLADLSLKFHASRTSKPPSP